MQKSLQNATFYVDKNHKTFNNSIKNQPIKKTTFSRFVVEQFLS